MVAVVLYVMRVLVFNYGVIDPNPKQCEDPDFDIESMPWPEQRRSILYVSQVPRLDIFLAFEQVCVARYPQKLLAQSLSHYVSSRVGFGSD